MIQQNWLSHVVSGPLEKIRHWKSQRSTPLSLARVEDKLFEALYQNHDTSKILVWHIIFQKISEATPEQRENLKFRVVPQPHCIVVVVQNGSKREYHCLPQGRADWQKDFFFKKVLIEFRRVARGRADASHFYYSESILKSMSEENKNLLKGVRVWPYYQPPQLLQKNLETLKLRLDQAALFMELNALNGDEPCDFHSREILKYIPEIASNKKIPFHYQLSRPRLGYLQNEVLKGILDFWKGSRRKVAQSLVLLEDRLGIDKALISAAVLNEPAYKNHHRIYYPIVPGTRVETLVVHLLDHFYSRGLIEFSDLNLPDSEKRRVLQQQLKKHPVLLVINDWNYLVADKESQKEVLAIFQQTNKADSRILVSSSKANGLFGEIPRVETRTLDVDQLDGRQQLRKLMQEIFDTFNTHRRMPFLSDTYIRDIGHDTVGNALALEAFFRDLYLMGEEFGPLSESAVSQYRRRDPLPQSAVVKKLLRYAALQFIHENQSDRIPSLLQIENQNGMKWVHQDGSFAYQRFDLNSSNNTLESVFPEIHKLFERYESTARKLIHKEKMSVGDQFVLLSYGPVPQSSNLHDFRKILVQLKNHLLFCPYLIESGFNWDLFFAHLETTLGQEGRRLAQWFQLYQSKSKYARILKDVHFLMQLEIEDLTDEKYELQKQQLAERLQISEIENNLKKLDEVLLRAAEGPAFVSRLHILDAIHGEVFRDRETNQVMETFQVDELQSYFKGMQQNRTISAKKFIDRLKNWIDPRVRFGETLKFNSAANNVRLIYNGVVSVNQDKVEISSMGQKYRNFREQLIASMVQLQNADSDKEAEEALKNILRILEPMEQLLKVTMDIWTLLKTEDDARSTLSFVLFAFYPLEQAEKAILGFVPKVFSLKEILDQLQACLKDQNKISQESRSRFSLYQNNVNTILKDLAEEYKNDRIQSSWTMRLKKVTAGVLALIGLIASLEIPFGRVREFWKSFQPPQTTLVQNQSEPVQEIAAPLIKHLNHSGDPESKRRAAENCLEELLNQRRLAQAYAKSDAKMQAKIRERIKIQIEFLKEVQFSDGQAVWPYLEKNHPVQVKNLQNLF